MRFAFILFLTLCITAVAFAQTNPATSGAAPSQYTHRDSVNLAKMNTGSNLLITAGVGFCAAGVYLIVEGSITYNTPNGSQGSNTQQNHRQGAGYISGGAIGIGAGVVMAAFGIKRKMEFKKRLKDMSMQGGLLDDGHLGAMLSF